MSKCQWLPPRTHPSPLPPTSSLDESASAARAAARFPPFALRDARAPRTACCALRPTLRDARVLGVGCEAIHAPLPELRSGKASLVTLVRDEGVRPTVRSAVVYSLISVAGPLAPPPAWALPTHSQQPDGVASFAEQQAVGVASIFLPPLPIGSRRALYRPRPIAIEQALVGQRYLVTPIAVNPSRAKAAQAALGLGSEDSAVDDRFWRQGSGTALCEQSSPKTRSTSTTDDVARAGLAARAAAPRLFAPSGPKVHPRRLLLSAGPKRDSAYFEPRPEVEGVAASIQLADALEWLRPLSANCRPVVNFVTRHTRQPRLPEAVVCTGTEGAACACAIADGDAIAGSLPGLQLPARGRLPQRVRRAFFALLTAEPQDFAVIVASAKSPKVIWPPHDVAAERAASFLLHAERESLRRALPLSSILSPAWRGELGPTAHGPKPMLSAAVLGGRH